MAEKDKGTDKSQRGEYSLVDEEENLDEEEGSGRPKGFKVIGAPPWIVTFADLTTLMLTFFVLLLSFANMDVVKYRQLLGSMAEAYGVTKESKGEHQLVQQVGSIAEKLGLKKPPKPIDPLRQEQNMLADSVSDEAIKAGMRDKVTIFYGEDGISVKISDSALFDSGSAILKESTAPFLEGMANIVRKFSFNLVIEGHTDNIPIRTRQFPSNWELSTVRATTVLRKLLEFGVPSDRLAAVGYADRKPIRENDTPDNRASNRRVEFQFKKKKG